MTQLFARLLLSLQLLAALSSGVVRAEDIANLVLDTPRLQLRAIDGINYAEAMEIWSDASVAEMSGDVIDAEMGRKMLALGATRLDKIDLRKPLVNFGIYLKGSPQLLGIVQAGANQDYSAYNAGLVTVTTGWMSLSYHLAPSAWGKGYATEMAQRVAKFIFETRNCNVLVADAIKSNVGSIKVMKKLGMQLVPGKPDAKSEHYYLTREMYEAGAGK